MSKAILVIDMPENCSKCKFMYEFQGIKKCQLLNALKNGGKAILEREKITSDRDKFCPLKHLPEKTDRKKAKNETVGNWIDGWNACIDALNREE